MTDYKIATQMMNEIYPIETHIDREKKEIPIDLLDYDPISTLISTNPILNIPIIKNDIKKPIISKPKEEKCCRCYNSSLQKYWISCNKQICSSCPTENISPSCPTCPISSKISQAKLAERKINKQPSQQELINKYSYLISYNLHQNFDFFDENVIYPQIENFLSTKNLSGDPNKSSIAKELTNKISLEYSFFKDNVDLINLLNEIIYDQLN